MKLFNQRKNSLTNQYLGLHGILCFLGAIIPLFLTYLMVAIFEIEGILPLIILILLFADLVLFYYASQHYKKKKFLDILTYIPKWKSKETFWYDLGKPFSDTQFEFVQDFIRNILCSANDESFKNWVNLIGNDLSVASFVLLNFYLDYRILHTNDKELWIEEENTHKITESGLEMVSLKQMILEKIKKNGFFFKKEFYDLEFKWISDIQYSHELPYKEVELYREYL